MASRPAEKPIARILLAANAFCPKRAGTGQRSYALARTLTGSGERFAAPAVAAKVEALHERLREADVSRSEPAPPGEVPR